MNIGCDVDDVLFHLAPQMVKYLNKKYNKNIKLKEIESYYLEELFGIGYDEIISASVVCSHFAPQVENAVEVINSTMNYVHFISNRRRVDLDDTFNYIKKAGLKIEWDLTHCDLGVYKKHDLINEFEIELFIEDNADTVASIFANTDCYTLLFDRPWNQKIENNSRVTRVHNWKEIKNFLENEYEWEAVLEVENAV